MSKTTVVLIVFLLAFVFVLLYIVYGPRSHSIFSSLSAPIRSIVTPAKTDLSFSTNTKTIIPGQTENIAVIIHNPNPHPTLVQLEIAYDPTMLTVDSITPGPFFTNPTVALQNIDSYDGRLSYALRCPNFNTSTTATDCANIDSPTVAVITVTANPYVSKRTTSLTFFPKTVVRTQGGHNILQSTNKMVLTIGNALYPVASTSAIASPAASSIQITPTP